MSDKLITNSGKNELLSLGFKTAPGAFAYLALGGINSEGATGGAFSEVSGSGYSRVETTVEEGDKKIYITGTFSEENYAPNADGTITEIGLCNTDVLGTGTYFMYSKVPQIDKTGDISLQYTILISID